MGSSALREGDHVGFHQRFPWFSSRNVQADSRTRSGASDCPDVAEHDGRKLPNVVPRSMHSSDRFELCDTFLVGVVY